MKNTSELKRIEQERKISREMKDELLWQMIAVKTGALQSRLSRVCLEFEAKISAGR